MKVFLTMAVIGWFVFGDPPHNLAEWFWSDDPAPWEDVDAFYYPSRADLFEHRSLAGIGSVEACRLWAYGEAARNGDPDMRRSTYECGVGRRQGLAGMQVYRLTLE